MSIVNDIEEHLSILQDVEKSAVQASIVVNRLDEVIYELSQPSKLRMKRKEMIAWVEGLRELAANDFDILFENLGL